MQSHKDFSTEDGSDVRNPFTVPSDHDIFALRDKEKEIKKKERQRQHQLKVHEKTTYTSRINARTKAMIRPAGDEEPDFDENELKDGSFSGGGGGVVVREDPATVLNTTKDRHVEKEHLEEYISKKREMFLVQYSLGVKRDEMRKLEEIAQGEEKKLNISEQYLEEDAAQFDEFLKDNDKNAVEAIKGAEFETKAKLEKVAEIKKINAQMMAVKSEISKNEDFLTEYMLYKKFLDKLTPREVHELRAKRLMEKRRLKAEHKANMQKKVSRVSLMSIHEKTPTMAPASNSSRNLRGKVSRMRRNSNMSSRRASRMEQQLVEADNVSVASLETVASLPSDEEDSDEEPELFFFDPMQLLDIFAELEEQNLSLIQNSQDTEEALDDMKKTIILTKDKMNRETEILKQQIETLKETISKEEERGNELKMKSKMFSFGEFKAEDQEKMLAQLNKKVEEVYRICIGDNEANISTLQMLTNIENRLEELFEMMEMMPPEKVEQAEKAKEKERRIRLREEKLIEQKRHQEERIRKAIERAQAEPKKKTGRRLVFRSCPPQTRKRADPLFEKHDKEEEDLKYFFT